MFGPGIERFAPSGYRQQTSTVEAIRQAAKVKGLEGLEMHYPGELNEGNLSQVKDALDEAGLRVINVGPQISQDPTWAQGALASLNEEVRARSIALVKGAIDIARELKAPLVIIWPGREGFDYPFTTSYVKLWSNYIDSLTKVAEYAERDVRVAIEYKIEDPSSYLIHGSTGRVLATILELRQKGINNVGINIEFAHSKLAREYVPEAVVLTARYGALYHLHYNDIFTGIDLDLVPVSVNLIEHAELLYWLHELGYEGWLGLDVYPRYMEPTHMLQASIDNVLALYKRLEKVGWEKIGKVVEAHDPLVAQQLLRELFMD
mgnify:CR=1 FL=1